MAQTLNQTLKKISIDLESLLSDLFLPVRAPLTDYSKIILTTATLDTGHWNREDPDMASTLQVANELRMLNPGTPVKVLLFDVPMTHYGHIEWPEQLVSGLFAALVWINR